MIGIANDAVLPVQVCAHPKRSFHSNTSGIDFSCIGDGVVYHFFFNACSIGEIILRSSNVIYCTKGLKVLIGISYNVCDY